MTRIKGYILIAVFILCVCFAIVLIEVQNDYERKLKEKDKIIKENQETIESQVRMLIELRDNCSCEWLYDFYLEHVCDENGCEVRE